MDPFPFFVPFFVLFPFVSSVTEGFVSPSSSVDRPPPLVAFFAHEKELRASLPRALPVLLLSLFLVFDFSHFTSHGAVSIGWGLDMIEAPAMLDLFPVGFVL